jgi:hypothetical protein
VFKKPNLKFFSTLQSQATNQSFCQAWEDQFLLHASGIIDAPKSGAPSDAP